MARAQASKLLDQLLGHNRDGEDKQVLDFMDIAVCRPFLFGICPNEMFLNTKMDMGKPVISQSNVTVIDDVIV